MAIEIRIECRVQYLRKGEWVTINDAEECTLDITGDLAERIGELQVENKRLRAALMKYAIVANWSSLDGDPSGKRYMWSLPGHGYDVAIDALDKEKETDDHKLA